MAPEISLDEPAAGAIRVLAQQVEKTLTQLNAEKAQKAAEKAAALAAAKAQQPEPHHLTAAE